MNPMKTGILPGSRKAIGRVFGRKPAVPRDPNLRAGSIDPVSPVAAALANPWFRADKRRNIC